MNLLLLDVPDPVRVAGPIGLILLAFVVLVITVALVGFFVFVLKRRKGPGANSANIGRSAGLGKAQPSNPNQP